MNSLWFLVFISMSMTIDVSIFDLHNEVLKSEIERQRLSPQARENAVIYVLCRNGDLSELVKTLKNHHNVFNKNYNYPYLFLNDEEFNENFKSTVKNLNFESEMIFGKIPVEHWSYPEWIDQEKASKCRKEADYIYGKSESYRHMCRFNSGFFSNTH